jgi:hypothetical protein
MNIDFQLPLHQIGRQPEGWNGVFSRPLAFVERDVGIIFDDKELGYSGCHGPY